MPSCSIIMLVDTMSAFLAPKPDCLSFRPPSLQVFVPVPRNLGRRLRAIWSFHPIILITASTSPIQTPPSPLRPKSPPQPPFLPAMILSAPSSPSPSIPRTRSHRASALHTPTTETPLQASLENRFSQNLTTPAKGTHLQLSPPAQIPPIAQ